MLRKMIVVAVVGGLAVAAFKGTKVASYVRNEVRAVREAAEEAIPPEREIARLRGEVKLLDEDAFKVVKQLARLQVDQEDLRKKEKALEDRKSKASEVMKARETAVRAAEAKVKAGEANVFVVFGEQKYSLDSGKLRLKETVRDYLQADKELTTVRAKVDTQQRIVDKLDGQRVKMGSLKSDLDSAIDELEVEVQSLNLMQMESRYQTDDTRLAQIKESIAKQQTRLRTQRKELALLQETDAVTGGAGGETVDEIMSRVHGAKATATPAMPKAGD